MGVRGPGAVGDGAAGGGGRDPGAVRVRRRGRGAGAAGGGGAAGAAAEGAGARSATCSPTSATSGSRTRWARPTATSSGASGASSRTRRTWSRFPRDESEIETVLSWAEAEGAAVIPFGGGTSVVGGVEARLGERPVVTLDLRRLDRVLEVDPESLAARIQAGATGPRLEEQLREHGLTLRHFPQSFEYATLGGWIATRAGGHFATLYTHIDDLVESVRAITPRGTWESRRLPGSGAGPSPGPAADRLRGDPRRDRRGLGAGAAAARVQGLLRGRVRRLPRRGARRCARSPSRACTRPTAACSTPLEAGMTGAGERRGEPAGPRLRVGAPPGRRADGAGARDRPRRTAACPASRRRRGRRGGRAATDAVGSLARRLPAGALPARHLRRLRRALARPSRRRSPGTASRSSTPT